MDLDPGTPRRMWHLFETVHGVTYFAEETRTAAADLGLRGFWAGYVVFRAAPLGLAAPAVVTAAFHGFGPSRVAKVLPAAWDAVSPEQAVEARSTSTAAALRAVFAAAGIGDERVEAAAAGLERAAGAVDGAGRVAAADAPGRVLAAPNAALPPRQDPYERLWQATATLREHRGDGHVAALVSAGIDPVESHLLKIFAGESPEEALKLGRAWDEQDWAGGARRLVGRGWTEGAPDGAVVLTDAGRAARDDVELRTDLAASGPWTALGEGPTQE